MISYIFVSDAKQADEKCWNELNTKKLVEGETYGTCNPLKTAPCKNKYV